MNELETISYPAILDWIGNFASLSEGRSTQPSLGNDHDGLELTYASAIVTGRHEVLQPAEGVTVFICEQISPDDLVLDCVGHPSITFAFRLTGETTDHFDGVGEVCRSGPACSIAVHGSVIHWRRHVPANTMFDALFITVTPSAIVELLGERLEGIAEELSFTASPAGGLSLHEAPLTSDMVAIVHAIKRRPRLPGVEKAFVAAKAKELACLAIAGLINARDGSKLPFGVHPRHVAGLMRAQAILRTEIAASHSLEALARRVGLSRTNLACGFKALHGQTVGEYLTSCRMQAAVERLRSGDTTIARIAPTVGYDSPYSFSRAFKRHFGVAPRGLDGAIN